jgi:hypothetical protein
MANLSLLVLTTTSDITFYPSPHRSCVSALYIYQLIAHSSQVFSKLFEQFSSTSIIRDVPYQPSVSYILID